MDIVKIGLTDLFSKLILIRSDDVWKIVITVFLLLDFKVSNFKIHNYIKK